MKVTGLRRDSSDDGYASLTAIVMCAAIATLCAGALVLASAEHRIEVQKLKRLQEQEAINTAVLRFVIVLTASDEPYRFSGDQTVSAGGQVLNVHLSAQSEYAKWPLQTIDKVSDASLSRVTSESRQELAARLLRNPNDDCVRSLFSELGLADVTKDLPTVKGALYTSSAKDGQVWRIRVIAGNRVEERRVRFLGDARHPVALLSIARLNVNQASDCKTLKL